MGLFEGERVNEGEGACAGAYGIKPPLKRTTGTACVSLGPTFGLV